MPFLLFPVYREEAKAQRCEATCSRSLSRWQSQDWSQVCQTPKSKPSVSTHEALKTRDSQRTVLASADMGTEPRMGQKSRTGSADGGPQAKSDPQAKGVFHSSVGFATCKNDKNCESLPPPAEGIGSWPSLLVFVSSVAAFPFYKCKT